MRFHPEPTTRYALKSSPVEKWRALVHDGSVSLQTEQVPKPNPPRLPSAEDSLALRIAYERMRRGWSADELAKRMTEAGVPLNQSAVWRIENGEPRRKISLDEAIGFARVFGLDLAAMTSEEPGDAIANQAFALIARMRETVSQLVEQRRELVRILAAATYVEGSPPESADQFVADLVRRFPWIEGLGNGVD